MEIRRVVPNLRVADLAATRDFYIGVLGLDVGMEMDWMVGLRSRSNPTAQVQLFMEDGPVMTVEVDDLDAAYSAAVERGARIVYGPAVEAWGVRRFFIEDPDGHVVNVMTHLPPTVAK